MSGKSGPTDQEVAEDFSLCMAPAQKKRLAAKLKNGAEAYAAHSTRLVERLRSGLMDVSGIQLPEFDPDTRPVLARLPIRVEDKQRTISEAKRQNIELAEWYSTPIHPIPSTQGQAICFEPEMCAHAENRTREVVSLPLHHRVTDQYVDKVIDFFQKAA